MSAMSASPVKPILPPSGVTSSPPKVAPPNTTTASITPNIPASACNLPGSPLKSAGMNHNTVSLSLISDNKVAPPPPQPASVTVPSVQPLPRTPEKPKEAVLPMNNVSPKVTSNGVPLIAVPAPVPVPAAAPIPTPPIATPAAPTSAPAPAPVPVSIPKQESPAKPEVAPVKPVTENKAPGAVIPPPSSVSAPPAFVPKPEPPAKTTLPAPVASHTEKKIESPLPETKPEIKAEAKVELKTPEKTEAALPVSTPTPAATPVSTTSSTSASVTPTTTSTLASSAPSTAVKTPVSAEASAPKPEVKAATPRTPKRKAEPKTPAAARSDTEERKSKRARLPTQPYQSPLPELTLITKMTSKPTPTKKEDDKLIVFYKNEFLAVRNAEGGFYVCQAMQNIYRSSSKIRIRWLSQDNSGVYIPDFYDHSDFECILTSLSLERVDKDKWTLPEEERLRTENILKRALDVEKGVEKPSVTEEHPDGLDLSLFKDESQLKKSRKSTSKAAKKPKPEDAPEKDEEAESSTPKTEKSSKKRVSTPAKTKKKATPAKKKTPARNSGAAAKSQSAAKKPAETKKVAVKRKAPKTTSPSTSFSSLTPAEKRRKVIENLTKQVSTNERSTKTRSAGGAVAAKISSAALKMVITKDRDRRKIPAVRKK